MLVILQVTENYLLCFILKCQEENKVQLSNGKLVLLQQDEFAVNRAQTFNKKSNTLNSLQKQKLKFILNAHFVRIVFSILKKRNIYIYEYKIACQQMLDLVLEAY